MYTLNLKQMTQQEFLDEYWQKKPVVIRQGFKDFVDPIAADELAGLAMEEQIESRLVHKTDGQWQAAFGPFESYEHLGTQDWSLVVQALDNFSEEAAEIIEAFRFLPHWRLDDLMASFAMPGGSVGPHMDNYDTFICQGSGKRHWRVGDNGQHIEFAAHEALLHVEPFEAIIDVELETGDILYIPPGFPHEGISLDTSMSFSVGFRANSAVSVLSAFADHLIDNEKGNKLLTDANRQVVSHSGEVTNEDYASIKNQIQRLLDDEASFKTFTGQFLTAAKHDLDTLLPDEPFELTEVSNLLNSHAIKRLGGLRAFYFEDTIEQGLCYINGTELAFSNDIANGVKLLCDKVMLKPDDLSAWSHNAAFVELATELLNQGYWYLAEAE
ncbi:cupin domain-containing protein [Colwellia psychrerythraea]|uniref:Transcription factor jumonji jmjC domain-containing protein n=1 Tax=Colwellia psychrerythraea TaxID=28229 RepID=A0A099KHY9_COLPS|nr:cupin domain-containing protein [Colwellia psychrerythraea]KGJ89880.1 transcription factor jumonji jmjC domain-containing protein [Colwellia psychrerythraea]